MAMKMVYGGGRTSGADSCLVINPKKADAVLQKFGFLDFCSGLVVNPKKASRPMVGAGGRTSGAYPV